MMPIYLVILSGKFNDTYTDICEKWCFEDLLFAQQAINDCGLVESIK